MDNLENVLDYEDGKKRIGGSAEIFNMVLEEYLKENKDVISELNEKIQNGDYEAAVNIVHKNKSSSGNIGANSLFEVASELQKSLQEKNIDDIKKNHEIFNRILQKVIEEIKNII